MLSTLAPVPVPAPGYAQNLLSLLEERDASIIAGAIERLLVICDVSWPQIASSLPAISALAEDALKFPAFRRAALLASRVAFHLEDEAESMRYALLAGDEFVRSPKNDFTLFVTCRLVDAFVAVSSSDVAAAADLERLVSGLVFSAVSSGRVGEALGLALEARRADWLEKILGEISESSLEVLDEFFALLRNFRSLTGTSAGLRKRVFQLLGERYFRGARSLPLSASTGGWWFGALRSFLEADEISSASGVFGSLLASEDDPQFGWLLSLQLALDLTSSDYNLEAIEFPSEPEEVVGNLREIVSRKFQTRATVDFLHRANKTDQYILDTLRSATSGNGGQTLPGNDIVHNAVVIANGLMNAGTTNDNFLRGNLDWLARANLWSKFTATLSLGVIHRGHHAQGRSILSTYLPSPAAAPGGGGRSAYSEGGALMGLGVVFGESGDAETREYLLSQLAQSSEGEVQQYGGCIGLGLVNLGRGTEEEVERVKTVLYGDNAVSGEAAGIGVGLLRMGSGDRELVEELLRYGKETSHEKISRGCMIGISLLLANKSEKTMIERMIEDETDTMTRYGGILTISMAYNKSGNEYAIKKLLEKAVYDSNDDVKRTSVIGLGFVLHGNKRLAKILGLLKDSYNPHIRYGVAIGLGIGMAGEGGEEEVVEILEKMTKDPVDFVRQGAWISLGMLMMQKTNQQTSEKMLKMASGGKGGEEGIVKMGGIIGLGMMNIGGRNGTIKMEGKLGLVGLLLYSQQWFGHSWTLGIGLAMKPTMMMGLTENLKMPRNFAAKGKTNQGALQFAYPTTMKNEDKKTQETSKPVTVLSVTRQKSKKLDKTPKQEISIPMETEEKKTTKRKLPENVIYFNPFRVVKGQEKIVEFFKPDELQPVRGKTAAASTERVPVRYIPLIEGRKSGWVILRDLRPQDEVEDLLDTPSQQPAPPVVATPAEQPAPPPEEFEWTEQ